MAKLSRTEYKKLEMLEDYSKLVDWKIASIMFSRGHCIKSEVNGEYFQHWRHRKQENLHRKTLGVATEEQIMGEWRIVCE